MEPRLVLVIGSRGIRLIRIVASSEKEEDKSINLYLKLRKIFQSIEKTLQSDSVSPLGRS